MERADPAMRSRHTAFWPGFTLVELAIVLVVIGTVCALWSAVLPGIHHELQAGKTRKTMAEIDQALLAFARTNNRLPCPDTSGTPNGLEGSGPTAACGAADVVGRVPHESLLLSGPVLDAYHAPVTYAVYRNPGALADLAESTNRIDRMNDVDIDNMLTSKEDIADFCQALKNGDAAAGASFASISTSLTAGGCGAGSALSQAWVLASAGLDDADGDAALFDEDNASAPTTCFSSPQRGRDASYDDLVSAASFRRLLGELCRLVV